MNPVPCPIQCSPNNRTTAPTTNMVTFICVLPVRFWPRRPLEDFFDAPSVLFRMGNVGEVTADNPNTIVRLRGNPSDSRDELWSRQQLPEPHTHIPTQDRAGPEVWRPHHVPMRH